MIFRLKKTIFLIFISLLPSHILSMKMPPMDTDLRWLEGQKLENYLAERNYPVETTHSNEPDIPLFTTTIHFVEAQEISYKVEPINKESAWKSQDTFAQVTADNARYALQEEAAHMNNAPRSEVSTHEHQIQRELISQENVLMSAAPAVSLNDTIITVDNTLKSAKKVQSLKELESVSLKKRNSFFTHTANINGAQARFISRFLEGIVSRLLEEIQCGNFSRSESAFKSLTNIWPFKHKNGFFVRECSGAEAQLIELIGVDIMKNAEITLISHPNYLASQNPSLIKEFNTSKATYGLLQRRGALETLKQAEKNLAKQLETPGCGNIPLLKAQAVALQVLLDDPLTEIYATIANGTPAQSELALEYIQNQTAEHYAKLNITDPAVISTDLIATEGHNTLQASQSLHETKDDFQKALEYEKTLIACPPEKLSLAIAHTSDLLSTDLTPAIRSFLENRTSALKEIANGKIVISNQEYKLSDELCAKLHEQGVDPLAFKQCQGNQLQQAIHQECIFTIECIVIANESSIIFPLAGPLMQLAETARMYSKHHSLFEATSITDFCLILIDYDIAILNGIQNGVIGTLSDFRKHPLETVATAIYGKGVLVYQLASHMCDTIGFGILAIENPEAAKAELKEHIKPITNLLAQIQNKQVSIRDVITGSSELATKLFLQNKVLGGLNSIFTGLKERALAFARSNPLATAEQYLVTPEGVLLKAAGGPGKNGPTFKNMCKDLPKKSAINAPERILKVTAKEATKIAEKMGFRKTNYFSDGQPVFQKGNKFITIDATSHNGGFWKMANSVKELKLKNTRMGTYDKQLNRIGD